MLAHELFERKNYACRKNLDKFSLQNGKPNLTNPFNLETIMKAIHEE